jgi:hypothetical protein
VGKKSDAALCSSGFLSHPNAKQDSKFYEAKIKIISNK